MDKPFSNVLAFHIVKDQSFLGRVLSYTTLRFTDRIPAMAVGFENHGFSLLVNPEWYAKADYDLVVKVIDHEGLHLILEHLIRGPELAEKFPMLPEAFAVISNVAADIAVNELLRGMYGRAAIKAAVLPKEGEKEKDPGARDPDARWLLPETFGLTGEQTYERYFEELLKKTTVVTVSSGLNSSASGRDVDLGGDDEIDSNGEGKGAGGKSGPGRGSGVTGGSAEMHETVRGIVADAYNDSSKSQGNIPASIKEIIDNILAPPKVNWLALFKNLAEGSRRSKPRRSIRRAYRRHMGIPGLSLFPGRVKDNDFHVVVNVDTSGSMGHDELSLALGILTDMQKASDGMKITIVESDCEVHRVYEIEAGDTIEPEWRGRGGTSFEPALIESAKYGADIVFYYTDGYASKPDPATIPKAPLVWLVSPGGSTDALTPGHVLSMDPETRR